MQPDEIHFYPINELRQMWVDEVITKGDLLDLTPHNCNLFTRLILDINFELSPNQEFILDTFFDPANNFKELLLVCGRKSFKTGIASIITLFKIYQSLVLIKDPHKHWGLIPGTNIYAMNVGPSYQEALDVCFNYIKALALSSPYLKRFIVDRKKEELHFKKHLVARVQSCSSRSGLGWPTLINVYDEQAHYLDTRGHMSGRAVYEALQPNLKVCKQDAISVCISTPAGRSGIFWELFKTGQPIRVLQTATEHDTEKWRAVFQYRTWEMNVTLPLGCDELEREHKRGEDYFNREFGAMFCDVIEAAIPYDLVIRCCGGSRKTGFRQIGYHVEDKQTRRVVTADPALTGCAYAVAMGHKDKDNTVVVDLIKYFKGKPGYPVNISEVEDFIENDLWRRFRISQIVLDQYQSASTVQKLKRKGLPIYVAHGAAKVGRQTYNQAAYEYTLRRMTVGPEAGGIRMPWHDRLINEWTFLQRKVTSTTVRYEGAAGHFDDGPDAIARLVYTLETEAPRALRWGWT